MEGFRSVFGWHMRGEVLLKSRWGWGRDRTDRGSQVQPGLASRREGAKKVRWRTEHAGAESAACARVGRHPTGCSRVQGWVEGVGRPWLAVAPVPPATPLYANLTAALCCGLRQPSWQLHSHVPQQRQGLGGQDAGVGVGGARPHQEALGHLRAVCHTQYGLGCWFRRPAVSATPASTLASTQGDDVMAGTALRVGACSLTAATGVLPVEQSLLEWQCANHPHPLPQGVQDGKWHCSAGAHKLAPAH